MFNLEEAVETWCRSAAGRRCGGTMHIEELKDHLFCEIDGLLRQGASEEDAFSRATMIMGDTADLSSEYSKNSGILDLDCTLPDMGNEPGLTMSNKSLFLLTLGYLVIFAIVTFVVTYFVSGSEYSEWVLAVLYMFSLVPVVLTPFVLGSGRSEWRCLKRRLFSQD